ncbi:MAG: hypothetical protein QOD68_3355 [Actinomycetota bacterium]|nr:hypothetical protein [Actinomycetota bacterium]
MPEQRDLDVVGAQTDTDLEYDLAHEWAADPHAARPHPGMVQVSTETDDRGGDYGYDMAHDVPRRSPTISAAWPRPS